MAPLELTPYERLKKEPPAAGLPWKLFSFVFVLLILAGAAYGGLRFGYGPILADRIEQIDSELEGLATQVPEAERQNFIQLYSQVVNLQSVLKNHVRASAVLPLIERTTHTGVYYTNMDLNVKERRVSLEGYARSYDVLAQQLEAWANTPQITKSYVSESQATDGRVRFRMMLSVASSLFSVQNATP